MNRNRLLCRMVYGDFKVREMSVRNILGITDPI